jgi:MarR family transcriptional regulator for hemolysin
VRPEQTPIGLQLARCARLVSRAFDEELSAAGGSLPVWLVLLNLKARSVVNQRALAESVGVGAPTLTHHLRAMEDDGLISRRRDPANRRNHILELTSSGEALFEALRAAALRFDARLRAGFGPEELDALRGGLDLLAANVAADAAAG